MKLKELTAEAYLNSVASDAPAPGGGSASAFCGAQGAGLISMVAGLTLKSRKCEAYRSAASAVQAAAQTAAAALTAQIDADAEAFNLVSAAFRLPKFSEKEVQIRSGEIQKASAYAAEVPLRTMELALDALKAAQPLLDGFNTSAASDLGVAALNLRSAAYGAWLNVAINCAGLKDADKAEKLRARGRSILKEAEALSENLRRAAEAAIGF